jgi:hypothetical protein
MLEHCCGDLLPFSHNSISEVGDWCWLGTQICPSDFQMVKRNSSLQRIFFSFSFHCSRVQWQQALHHSSRHLALHMVSLGLCAAAWPWKPVSWSSRRTVHVLMLLPEAVWYSVVSDATEDRSFYALRASALGCPVLWACVVAYHFTLVAPRCFHFYNNSTYSWPVQL